MEKRQVISAGRIVPPQCRNVSTPGIENKLVFNFKAVDLSDQQSGGGSKLEKITLGTLLEANQVDDHDDRCAISTEKNHEFRTCKVFGNL